MVQISIMKLQKQGSRIGKVKDNMKVKGDIKCVQMKSCIDFKKEKNTYQEQPQ